MQNNQNAQEEARVFTKAGYKVSVIEIDFKNIGTWFRVYVGPYTTRAEAMKVADNIKETGLSNYAAVIDSDFMY